MWLARWTCCLEKLSNFPKIVIRPSQVSDIEEKIISSHCNVLAVGEVFQWCNRDSFLPTNALVSQADFKDVDIQLYADPTPDIVLSRLVCRNFDFLDLAQKLQAANYNGLFSIVAPKLPNPGIVIAEAKAAYPGIKIKFICGMRSSIRLVE